MVVCPECGSENGDNAFLCTGCGSVIATDLDLSDDRYPAAGWAPAGSGSQAESPGTRRSPLSNALMAVAALALLGLVTAVVMASGRSVGLDITSPGDGSRVRGELLHVSLAVTNPGKVTRIEVRIDDAINKTITGKPFIAEVHSGAVGRHTIRASAYDLKGKLLAEATVRYVKVTETETGLGESANVAIRDRAGPLTARRAGHEPPYLAVAALQYASSSPSR